MALGTEVGLSPVDIVLDGDPAPPTPKKNKGHNPQFLAHVYCGQTAGRIKMSLGTKKTLAQATLCSKGIQLLPLKGAKTPIF